MINSFHKQKIKKDLSAGNGGPPNKLAPPSEPIKLNKQPLTTTQQQQPISRTNIALENFQSNPTPSSQQQQFQQSAQFPKIKTELNSSHFGQQVQATSSLVVTLKEETVATTATNASTTDVIKEEQLTIKSEPFVVDGVSATTSTTTTTTTTAMIKSENKPVKNDDVKDPGSSADAGSSTGSGGGGGGSGDGSDSTPMSVVQVTPGIAKTTKGPNGKPVITFPPDYLRDKLLGITQNVLNKFKRVYCIFITNIK